MDKSEGTDARWRVEMRTRESDLARLARSMAISSALGCLGSCNHISIRKSLFIKTCMETVH